MGGVDFAIIYTAHVHPVESLNFLSILPFLNEGAIVVLHDISEYTAKSINHEHLAPRILYSSVVAEVITPRAGYEIEWSEQQLVNICAFQITADTRKYIRNVFDALFIPWEIFVYNELPKVGKLIQQHYPNKLTDKFNELGRYYSCHYTGVDYKHNTMANEAQDRLSQLKYVYGVGAAFSKLCCFCYFFAVTLEHISVWDANAENIQNCCGHRVEKPVFAVNNHFDSVLITIEDRWIAAGVAMKLMSLGYNVFLGLKDYLNNCPYGHYERG